MFFYSDCFQEKLYDRHIRVEKDAGAREHPFINHYPPKIQKKQLKSIEKGKNKEIF